MMNELEDRGGLLSAPHYYWGACFVCARKSSVGAVMKRCTRCKSVFYCSQEHQKKNWKEHRDLCKYLATAANNADQVSFFSGVKLDDMEEWKKFRMNAVITCEILLSTTLSLAEKEIFLFPRACRVCNSSQEMMQDCEECFCVSYCSSQHQEEDENNHILMCRPLRMAMLADTYESKVGICVPSIPSEVDRKYLGTAPDITHFLPEPHRSSDKEISLPELEHCMLTCQLSGGLTILHSIDKYKPQLTKKTNLVIHIAGANIYEMVGLIKWEYLLHRLPDVESIEYHFVGPELQEDEEDESPAVPPCDDCVSKSRKVTYSTHGTRYSQFKKQGDFTVPDIVLVQNAGFSEFQDSEDTVGWTSGWSDLSHLVPPSQDSLLIFTSYTKGEADKDLERMAKYCDIKVLVSEENPMRSFRPCRDWERDQNKDIFYSNQYYTVVQAADIEK